MEGQTEEEGQQEDGFCNTSSLLTMPTAVIARAILFVCLSVHPSITFWCFVPRNEDTIVRFSASGRKIILVSEELKFIRIFAGDHLSKIIKVKHRLSLSILCISKVQIRK